MDAELEVYDAQVVIDRALAHSHIDGHTHAGVALHHKRYDLDLTGRESMLSEGVGVLCHDKQVFRVMMWTGHNAAGRALLCALPIYMMHPEGQWLQGG